MTEKTAKSERNMTFWAHLFLLILSWAAPFLLDWRLLCLIYGAVLLQFVVFKRCLMNEGHGIDERLDDYTFYAELLEALGFRPARKPLKQFVRSWLYLVLATTAIVWQEGLEMEPALF